jgi:predicted PurR-regulated permease PerM
MTMDEERTAGSGDSRADDSGTDDSGTAGGSGDSGGTDGGSNGARESGVAPEGAHPGGSLPDGDTPTSWTRTPGPETGSPVDPGITHPGPENRFGLPGLPVNRAHPFYIGFMGALGVLLAYWLVGLVGQLSSVLTLVVIALFLALGLDPAVQLLQRLGLRRNPSVAIVFVGVIGLFVGFVAAVAPALVTQGTQFSQQLPDLLDSFQNSAVIQRLDREYGLISGITEQVQQRLTSGETALQLFGGVFGAGRAVVSGTFSAFTVLVLTLYFLASMHAMTEAAYRLVPASRRDRVRLLSEEIIRRIGAYIAGQISVASINGFFTYVMLSVLGLQYRLVLAITVGLFGLIPLVGATIGAGVIILVALFHSWQYAVIVLVYYVVYQQVENYLIAPKIMSRTVSVPGAVAVIAALAGGTLLGVVGALLAIPVAAGVLLIIQEVVVPRQARS